MTVVTRRGSGAAEPRVSRKGEQGGLAIQVRTISALLMRELHSRYGRENIGYLWLIGEPMCLATVITLAHVSEPTRFSSDIQPAPFAIVGYCTFIIFRGIFSRAEGALEQNQSLLYHQRVSTFDIMMARALLEVVGCFATGAILLTLAIAAGFARLPARPLFLLSGVGLMAWFSFATAMIAASVTYRRETLGRQLHVIAYITIPVSGAFFMMKWLPSAIRDPLSWYPMPLILEQVRYGQFEAASADFVQPGYVAAWCAGLTLMGLILLRRVRRRIYGA